MKRNLLQAFTACIVLPVFFSCATYNSRMAAYYARLRQHDYEAARHSIEKNKSLKKERNKLLYTLELGTLYRMQNKLAESNEYLNAADGLIESNKKSVGDIAVGNLINPMQQRYLGEGFEPFMVHYYKALNYAALGLQEDAVVEARRITLSLNAQNDKARNKSNRYGKDAFALNLQGMIYESAGDINNAFISYRNAADVYAGSNENYYGVQLPLQLKKDVVRTAGLMGFTGDQQRYQKLFNMAADTSSSTIAEAIIFIEEGQAPVKQERNFFVTTAGNGPGVFNYLDENGRQVDFNFNYIQYGLDAQRLSSVRALRVAMPYYAVQYPSMQKIIVSDSANSYTPVLVQNINALAIAVLKERFFTELANALARQLTKKLLEAGTQAAAESVAKNNSNNKNDSTLTKEQKEKQQQKNDANAKLAGEVAGFLMNMVNTATEKADTRNWQSLPAFISYVRIPLHQGNNTITISAGGKSKTLQLQGHQGLQLTGVAID